MTTLALITIMIGAGILVTDTSLTSMCQRCWLNYLLFSVFGEEKGKFVFSLIWLLVGLGILGFAWKLPTKVHFTKDKVKKINKR